MGFLPELAATIGRTALSIGATAAGTAQSALGTITGAGQAAAGATGGISSTVGAAAQAGAVGLATQGAAALFKPPKPPPAPTPPNPASFFSKTSTSLFGPDEGTAGGTFLGNNRSPQISGGKKTLLGQ